MCAIMTCSGKCLRCFWVQCSKENIWVLGQSLKKWVNLRCFDGLLLLVWAWGCVFFLFWALIILLGEVGCSKFGHSSRCGGFPIQCWLDCFAKIVKYLIGCSKIGHSSRCGGFPIHCWLDCFASFVKRIVRLLKIWYSLRCGGVFWLQWVALLGGYGRCCTLVTM